MSTAAGAVSDTGSTSDDAGIFFVSGDLVDIHSPKWQALPTEMLRAMLSERQGGNDRPACSSAGGGGSYNTSIHVFALFLILFLSTAACAFPIIAKRFPGLSIPHSVLFISRHFGTGVLIATAFVHLLPTAFVSLTDPCLPYFWNQGYPAMAGLIAMTAVMLVVGTEMFFASRGAGHVHGGDFEQLLGDEHEYLNGNAGSQRRRHTREHSLKRFQRTSFERGPAAPEDESALLPHASPLPSGGEPSPHPFPDIAPELDDPREVEEHQTVKPLSDSDSNDDDDDDLELELNELDPMPVASNSHSRTASYTPLQLTKQRNNNPARRALSPPSQLTNGHTNPADPLSTHQAQQKLLLQCLLLEAGILFHSIFIGMALSVSTGPPFYVFLLAISFHQTFEGLALGSRISSATSHFGRTSPKPWLMCLAFGATTPVGQAIGLGIHNLYDPGSEVGLIVVGVTNAISSGLLLFAGLVELLAEDFLSDESYETLRGRRRLHACAAVVSGAALMALVGAWA